ncbi:alpha/beta hydrolase [Hymenobacter jeollabukensis]|uniref:Alpha/beta hydrolase n=1 Tax=Hymenobacter jeollabukensis TaxID=2025313 RepID=A0A5R8WMK1_9BACT|nr:alpha/beta hydrolase [Hymenobacter jeollabukensis]TLM90119.1 alpha/beta hydrolase [Hymenobacter jeollabukensis]
MENRSTRTIVFLTGAFVSHHCWDEWQAYFEARGYTCLVPPWLYKDASVEELRRRHPDPQLASLRLPQLIDHFAGIIRELPEKPILIGHSYGGLLTQLLVQRDLAAAGVAIDSVAPQGVFTFRWSFYRATWGPLGFLTDVNKPFMMSFRQWQYAFVNGMPLDEQRAAYEQITIPESKRISRDGLTRAARVDFRRPHVPLLLVAGAADHIMPASLNYSNYRRYAQHAGSVTNFKEFAGRNHFTLGQPGWQEVADFVLSWLQRQEQAPAAAEAAVTELAGVY